MNTLILNRETFQMPEDGWYQIAPIGEFPHGAMGVIQVVDTNACTAMVNAFREESGKANFAGLLIDFDHFSLDDKLKSEAAGWIVALEARVSSVEGGDSNRKVAKNTKGGEAGAGNRVESQGGGPASSPTGTTPRQSPADAGLWAKIRWSDVGEEAVKGGRYRFLSPVWAQRDCEDLGDGRLRPVRLLNAAVTNDPNLKGMRPLSNSGQFAVGSGQLAGGLANAGGGEPGDRYRWELGVSPDGRHCPSCEGLAGQVHTKAEWDAAGLSPGSGDLYCQGSCHCSLVKTDEPATGELADAPRRAPSAVIASRDAYGDVLANIGWSDEARVVSLAVRRAKAELRKKQGTRQPDGNGVNGAPDAPAADADEPTPEAEAVLNDLTDEIRGRLRDGESLAEALKAVVDGLLESGMADAEGDVGDDVTPELAVMQEKARVRAKRG